MRSLIPVVAFVIACGSSTAVPDGGGADSGADTTTTDGAVPNDSGPASNSIINTYIAPDGGFGANAVFGAPNAPSVGCPTIVVGACTAYNCTGTQSLTYSPPSDNPGTLTIAGGNPNLLLTLVPVASAGTYSDRITTSASTFAPGATITFNATGATVPAFQDSVTVPATPTITGPAIDGSAIDVSRAADFAVAWTGGDADEIVVSISNSSASGYIACEFPASATKTSAVVPAAVLTNLPVGSGTLGFTAAHTKVVTVGAYSVKIIVAPTLVASTPITIN